jgi:hypothetical protein
LDSPIVLAFEHSLHCTSCCCLLESTCCCCSWGHPCLLQYSSSYTVAPAAIPTAPSLIYSDSALVGVSHCNRSCKSKQQPPDLKSQWRQPDRCVAASTPREINTHNGSVMRYRAAFQCDITLQQSNCHLFLVALNASCCKTVPGCPQVLFNCLQRSVINNRQHDIASGKGIPNSSSAHSEGAWSDGAIVLPYCTWSHQY